jgi:hypothetical protein
VVRLDGKTATGIEVPTKELDSLNGGKRPRVTVTINAHTYRSSVGSMGGRYLIPVSQDVRAKAGVQAGDVVTVDVELDVQPREVAVPADLVEAMANRPSSRRVFDQLSYTARHRHVLAIEGAKSPETRQRRLQKVVDELLAHV